jgi:flagellar hook-basal body complex protein FliE
VISSNKNSMPAPISPIILPTAAVPPSPPAVLPAASGPNFQSLLRNAVDKVETATAQASAAVAGYMAGSNQELHSTILAAQNADLNFEMFMQVRNKVVSAYEEVMRMQV